MAACVKDEQKESLHYPIAACLIQGQKSVKGENLPLFHSSQAVCLI